MNAKVSDTLKLLSNDGWRLIWQKGYHRQYKHPVKAGLVMIAGNPNDDIAPETLHSILKQTHLISLLDADAAPPRKYVQGQEKKAACIKP